MDTTSARTCLQPIVGNYYCSDGVFPEWIHICGVRWKAGQVPQWPTLASSNLLLSREGAYLVSVMESEDLAECQRYVWRAKWTEERIWKDQHRYLYCHHHHISSELVSTITHHFNSNIKISFKNCFSAHKMKNKQVYRI